MRTSARVLDAASRVLGVLPWLAGFVLASAAAYIRLSFGRWPRAFRDSVDVPFENLAVLATIAATVSPVIIVLLVLLLLLLRGVLGVRPIFNRWVVSALVGSLVVYLVAIWDPSGFVEWTFD